MAVDEYQNRTCCHYLNCSIILFHYFLTFNRIQYRVMFGLQSQTQTKRGYKYWLKRGWARPPKPKVSGGQKKNATQHHCNRFVEVFPLVWQLLQGGPHGVSVVQLTGTKRWNLHFYNRWSVNEIKKSEGIIILIVIANTPQTASEKQILKFWNCEAFRQKARHHWHLALISTS